MEEPHPPTAEERLRESEARYRLIADHTRDVIWTMDLRGRFTYVSPSVERLRGYTVEEVMQHQVEGALSADDAREILEAMQQTVETYRRDPSASHRRVLPQPCKDGSEVWTEVITNGMYDADGELVGILGVTRDITDQHRAEQELRQAKETAERALAQVRTLSGLLPMCSHCKKIRDDKGFWSRVEVYISTHTDALVSHGLCPDCIGALYPELLDSLDSA